MFWAGWTALLQTLVWVLVGLQMCCFVGWVIFIFVQEEKKQNKFPCAAPAYPRSTNKSVYIFIVYCYVCRFTLSANGVIRCAGQTRVWLSDRNVGWNEIRLFRIRTNPAMTYTLCWQLPNIIGRLLKKTNKYYY
jgi:hypothetical protein